MTKKELVAFIRNDITLSGALAIQLPDEEIERIIDFEKNALYEFYPDALQERFIILHPNIFRTSEFKTSRVVEFPACVYSISKFEEIRRRNGLYGFNDPDISFNKAFMSEMWMGLGLNMDFVTYQLINWSTWDMCKQLSLVDIQHSFNRATHTLLVLGHDPLGPVRCEMFVKIPDENLFDDYWCKKYLCAKAKLSVNRLIGTFTTQLVGGVTVNAATYTEAANSDIEQCKEYWQEMRTNYNAAGWVEMW